MIEKPKISYESSEFIEEIKQDILEFGENYPCILVYKPYKDTVVYTNYDFINHENPFNPETELLKDEKYMQSTLLHALQVFEEQNKLF